MRKFITLLIFLFIFSSTSFAQNDEAFVLEVITPDNAEYLEEIVRWEGFRDSGVAGTFSSDDKWLAIALGDGTVQILEATTFSQINVLNGAEADGHVLLFNEDNSRLALTDQNGIVLLWDIESSERITFFQPHQETIVFSEISKNLSTFIIHDTSENTVTSYNIETAEIYTTIPYNAVNPRPALSPDGMLILTGDLNNNLQIWNSRSGEPIAILETTLETPEEITSSLNGFGFTPEGHIWATWQVYLHGEEVNSQSIIQVWEKETYEPFYNLTGSHIYYRVYFSSNSQYVIAAGENAVTISGGIWLWDRNDGIETELIGVPGGMVASINPNNDIILIGSGTSPFVVVQSTNELVLLSRLAAPSTLIPSQFNSNGKMILSIGQDITIWGVRTN